MIRQQQERPYYKPTYSGMRTKLAIKAETALFRYASAICNEEEVWAWWSNKTVH